MYAFFRLIGLFALIPTTVLLTVSFFVLFTLRKIESKNLKSFGRVIVLMLWACALLVFLTGVYVLSTDYHPMHYKYYKYMKGGSGCYKKPWMHEHMEPWSAPAPWR